MPVEAKADMKAIKEGLSQAFSENLREVVERPVAFGLVALEAIVVMEDAGGQLDRSEETIKNLPGVGSVETVGVDLL